MTNFARSRPPGYVSRHEGHDGRKRHSPIVDTTAMLTGGGATHHLPISSIIDGARLVFPLSLQSWLSPHDRCVWAGAGYAGPLIESDVWALTVPRGLLPKIPSSVHLRTATICTLCCQGGRWVVERTYATWHPVRSTYTMSIEPTSRTIDCAWPSYQAWLAGVQGKPECPT